MSGDWMVCDELTIHCSDGKRIIKPYLPGEVICYEDERYPIYFSGTGDLPDEPSAQLNSTTLEWTACFR